MLPLTQGDAGMAKEPARRGRQPKPDEPVAGDNLSSVASDIIAPTEEGISIREVRQRIAEAFAALGTNQLPGTIIPAGQRNNAQEAAEFVVADVLAKLAADRQKKASEAADKAGVFGDPAEYVIGDTVMVYSDPNFSINVKMGKPSKMLDRKAVEAAAAKYLGKKSEEFLAECQKDRAATKQIIVSMK